MADVGEKPDRVVCYGDSWQHLPPSDRNWLDSASQHAFGDGQKAHPPSPQMHKENDPPAHHEGCRQDYASLATTSGSSTAAGPTTPQRQHPLGSTSTFKQRVQAKMAELERSIQKVAPGHSRLGSRSATGAMECTQDSCEAPEHGAELRCESRGALPVFSPVAGTADSYQSPSGSTSHARGSPRDPTVQRLAYQTAGTTATDKAAAEWQVESHLAPVLERTKAELDATRRHLAGAREQMQHLQVSVAHEHEARLVAERSLSEANAVALPASAAAELNIREVSELRRRVDAAEATAESRRKALLAEKAKAQNALGQLAISRERVKITQSRLRQQQDDADKVAAQLTERTAECHALAEELSARRPAPSEGRGSMGARLSPAEEEALRCDLEVVQRQLQASHGANAELRCQVDLLQQKLAQAERRARMAAATAAPPTPAVAAPDTLRHEAMQPVASGSATVMADLTAARRDLAAAHAEVAVLQKQERRQRQRAEAAEREVARLQDEVCGASEEVAQLTKAASNAQLAAAEAERTLLDQALEMDDLQQAAAAAGRLRSETEELRAAEATAQLRAAEAVRERDEIQTRLDAAQQAASHRGGTLAEQQRELKRAQTARAQQQRALERQEAKIEQLQASLAARDAELAAHRRNATQLHHQRTAAESWLDD